MSVFRKVEFLPSEDDSVVCRCCDDKMECMMSEVEFANLKDEDCKRKISVINNMLNKLGLENIKQETV